jgi:potassium efflux system protein
MINFSGCHYTISTRVVALCLVLCLSHASLAIATTQEETSRREAELVTQSMLDEGLKSAQANKDLDEETLNSIQNIYDKASRDLKEMDRLAEEEARFKGTIQSAEQDLTQAKLKVKSETPPLKKVSLPQDATVDQIEAELRNLKARENKMRKEQRALAAEPARREARLQELPEAVTETETKLRSLTSQLEVPAIAGEPEAMTRARDLGLRAEGQMVQQKLATLQVEQNAYLATADLVKLNLELVTRKVKQLQQQIKEVEATVDSVRQQEIKNLAEETNATAEQALEEPNLEKLKPYAKFNVTLSEQMQLTAEKVSQAEEAATTAKNAQQKLQQDLDTAKQRVGSVKLSDAMGVMLRQDKEKIKKLRSKFANVATMEDTVLMRVERYRLEDLKAEVEDPKAAADVAIKELKASAQRAKQLREPLIRLFESRKETLAKLVDLQENLISALNERERAELKFSKTSHEYTSFINEHILWIRSARPIGYGERDSWTKSIAWLTNPEHWQSVAKAVTLSVVQHLPLSIPWIALAILMGAIHPSLSNRIYAAGLVAEKPACRSFLPTSKALVRTLIKSLMWPSFLYVVGKLMMIGTENSPFTVALALSMMQTALIILPIELLRQTCRGKGLAESHLEWHAHSCKAMKRDLDWFLPVAVILLVLTLVLRNHGEETWNGTLGRAVMCVLLAISAFVMYRMMRPGALFFMRTAASETKSTWTSQLSYLRLVLLPGVPIVLLVFAVAGYNYTAMELGKVWLQTIAVGILLLILYMVALRFFLVRRRRLRYEQLIEQREQAKKQAEKSDNEQTESIAKALAVDLKADPGLDITDVSKQARELTGVMFGLLAVVIFWNLWQELLPATRIFDEWKLWTAVTGENGEIVKSVTLRDLLVSLMLFGLTFLGVRNIPGLLELLLLKQLPLDAGSRYAVSTIVRYIITVAGVILALNFLKIPWNKYSWLVAAISVGLGFGLQEIVANFVSGLILLLERPVRVGDVVTIDGTTGIISRIQMRATTITNWDNQELVVPNKDLITGKLMNWTLSSVINRVAADVGVAYGSDPEQVKEILMKVADENPDVLDDPPPLVSFEQFGDSSLNFKLRYCITSMSRRIMIVHAINTAIYRHLTEAGIEIPFPQRDVNMNLPDGFAESLRNADK